MSLKGQREWQTIADPSAGRAASPSSAFAQYVLGERVGAGGMGAVHVGFKVGALGFQRPVAIKRLHAHLADDADFVARFKDEIRVVSQLTHPNVVQTFDVIEAGGELVLVMEFVNGVTLHELLVDARAAGVEIPVRVAASILNQALYGLHAAHEALDHTGRPLFLVHRDVSPQNLMIGRDGLVKVLDFGVAKAASETHVTRTGQLSGKAAYMSPEQISARTVDRKTDVFAAGVVLWEVLTGERLFRGPGMSESAALRNILEKRVPPPSKLRLGISEQLDRAVLCALERDPALRLGSARDFALALEAALPIGSAYEIGELVADACCARLARRAEALQRFRERLGPAERHQVQAEFITNFSLPPVGSTDQTNCELISLCPDLSSVASSTPPAEPEMQTADMQSVLLAGPTRTRRFSSRVAHAALALAGFGLIGLGLRSALGRYESEPSTRETPPDAALPIVTMSAAAFEQPKAAAASSPAEVEPAPAHSAFAVQQPARRQSAPLAATQPSSQVRKRAAAPARTDLPSRGLRPRPPQANPCSPPTYTGADGIRHFKRECL